MTLFINPGTGPVADATPEQAAVNIEQFVKDVTDGRENYQHVLTHRLESADYGEGRYAFVIVFRSWTGLHAHEIQMPGLPLERVNFGARTDDNAWDFPRLYVDDGSRLWKFAITCCHPDDEG